MRDNTVPIGDLSRVVNSQAPQSLAGYRDGRGEFTPPPPYAHLTTTYPPSLMSQPPSTTYPSSYTTTPARVPSPATSVFSHSASLATPDSVVDATFRFRSLQPCNSRAPQPHACLSLPWS